MDILIVSATKNEIAPFLEHFKMDQVQSKFFRGMYKSHSLNCILTGIGMIATTFELTLALREIKYDLVINAGIAGAYSSEIPIGSLVNVNKEMIGDLGIDDRGKFSTIFEAGLVPQNWFPYANGSMLNHSSSNMFSGLKTAKGLTVNTVSGSNELINLRKEKFKPDIETMEGAAVFHVCLSLNLEFAEIRAISNLVEPRNREGWNISLAIANLNSTLIDIFEANL